MVAFPIKNILLDVYKSLPQTGLVKLASLFKCLADPTRLRIVNLLLRGPLCVCDIQHSLRESQVKTSKHLGYMKKHGLLTVERKANWNFYAIAEDLPRSVADCLEAIKSHATSDPQLKADLEPLRQNETATCC